MAMRKSCFTEEQIAHVLRQAETGTPATEVCRGDGGDRADLLSLEEAVWRVSDARDPPAQTARANPSYSHTSNGIGLIFIADNCKPPGIPPVPRLGYSGTLHDFAEP